MKKLSIVIGVGVMVLLTTLQIFFFRDLKGNVVEDHLIEALQTRQAETIHYPPKGENKTVVPKEPEVFVPPPYFAYFETVWTEQVNLIPINSYNF